MNNRMNFGALPAGISRRQFLARSSLGFGAMALWQLLSSEGATAPQPHFAPRAKNVIFMFMVGGQSHLDLFDPKPQMAKWHGQPPPESLVASLPDPQIKAGTLMASRRAFKPYGQSGIEYSELVPHTAAMADEICLIRSLHCEQSTHDAAELLFHSGSPLFGNPSIGSWVNYGLGSACENLPGYLVLISDDGRGLEGAGSALWGSGFMPSTYRGVTFRNSSDPILHLNLPAGISAATQRARLDALADLNRLHQQSTGDAEIASRIASYEMAFRMQTAAPELLDFSQETAATCAMYGLDAEQTRPFGANCLLARRMIERGVRFVHLLHTSWDDHSHLDKHLANNCGMTDLPTAGLLQDLKQRGLLDETLLVWAGEFGRTPMGEVRRGSTAGKEGRDHHPFAFSAWMAGGGVQGGRTYGATDEFGYNVVENPVHVHDLQATILHLLGIDHERLTYRHAGRDYRLTDVAGKVVKEILS
jgi:uncharacterized protein (DUF1501 family)